MASCDSDDDGGGAGDYYTNLGMQRGEETSSSLDVPAGVTQEEGHTGFLIHLLSAVATTLRLVALCISISVLFPWIDPKRRGHMRIFFLHWISGVLYVMSQFIMSVMVLNCWTSKRTAGPIIFMLKFVELVVLNLWSISSLAIAVLIAVIVQSFSKFRRVPAMIGSKRTAYGCMVAALVATILSASFWNGILVTGGYFWVTNNTVESHARWITLSFGATQTAAGILMAVAVVFTITGERRASLVVCCKTNQRVYFHFILTIFGTCVYVYNGVVLLIDELYDNQISRHLVIIGWCSRYAHVIADTAIIFGAFHALMKKEREELQGIIAMRDSDAGSGGVASSVVNAPAFTPLPRPSSSASVPREGGRSGRLKSTPGLTPASNDPVSATSECHKYYISTKPLDSASGGSAASRLGAKSARIAQSGGSSSSSCSSVKDKGSGGIGNTRSTGGQKLFSGEEPRWPESRLTPTARG